MVSGVPRLLEAGLYDDRRFADLTGRSGDRSRISAVRDGLLPRFPTLELLLAAAERRLARRHQAFRSAVLAMPPGPAGYAAAYVAKMRLGQLPSRQWFTPLEDWTKRESKRSVDPA